MSDGELYATPHSERFSRMHSTVSYKRETRPIFDSDSFDDSVVYIQVKESLKRRLRSDKLLLELLLFMYAMRIHYIVIFTTHTHSSYLV